jgi:hypothetical protein
MAENNSVNGSILQGGNFAEKLLGNHENDNNNNSRV